MRYIPLASRGLSAAATPTPISSGDIDPAIDQIMRGLAYVETRDAADAYTKLGPVSPRTGDRAHGKYQFMGAYIPDWTEQYLGRRLTPRQLLASPELQDELMKRRAADLYRKYGNIYDVASVHFTGRPLARARADQAKDYTGTTVDTYMELFNRGIGKAGTALAAAPEQGRRYVPLAVGGIIRATTDALRPALSMARYVPLAGRVLATGARAMTGAGG